MTTFGTDGPLRWLTSCHVWVINLGSNLSSLGCKLVLSRSFSSLGQYSVLSDVYSKRFDMRYPQVPKISNLSSDRLPLSTSRHIYDVRCD